MSGTRTVGRDALLELGRGIGGMYASAPMRHVVTNVVIDVDGDDATSESYLQILSVGPQPSVMTTGVYHDRLRRVDGCWRFTERVMEPDAR